MHSGVLSHSERTRRLHTFACKIQQSPRCSGCQIFKKTCRATPGHTTSIIKDPRGVLRQEILFPGQEVSVYHFVCSIKGQLFSFHGKSSNDKLLCGGCIFFYHSLNYVHIEDTSSVSSHEALRSKIKFEQMCRNFGVISQQYMTDNVSTFISESFNTHLAAFKHHIRFTGAGSQYHNGHAEQSIQTIVSILRTMMLHAAIHWPDISDAALWPMTVSRAVFLWNYTPDPPTGLSHSDLLTKIRWPQCKFHDLHFWGCQVYVLNKTISDGKKIPRWKSISQRMFYMGLSPNHASSVPLILNPATGSITPQFHVVFDDWFATVPSDEHALPEFNSPTWSKLFGESRFQYYFDIDNDAIDNDGDINNARAAETFASSSDIVETAI